jgi:hypothetical protein
MNQGIKVVRRPVQCTAWQWCGVPLEEPNVGLAINNVHFQTDKQFQDDVLEEARNGGGVMGTIGVLEAQTVDGVAGYALVAMGDWVVQDDTGVSVYTHEEFSQQFEAALPIFVLPELTDEQIAELDAGKPEGIVIGHDLARGPDVGMQMTLRVADGVHSIEDVKIEKSAE